MLSILIPTYNYNCFPLVNELHQQASLLKITFEIICIDDASNSHLNQENKHINTLQNASFIELQKNLGRSAIRNFLAEKAQYHHLLFLDADVFPKETSFLKTMLLHKDEKVVFGGIDCSIKTPNNTSILRWKYSLQRECKQLHLRKKNPFYSFTSASFLIQKDIFNLIKFDESLEEYGCEDVLFAHHLKQQNILIIHINNPVYHDNIETSNVFVRKTKLALHNLLYIISQEKLPKTVYNVSEIHSFIQKIYLSGILNFIFKITEKTVLKNLYSKRPSLVLFDFYKLGFFNSLNTK